MKHVPQRRSCPRFSVWQHSQLLPRGKSPGRRRGLAHLCRVPTPAPVGGMGWGLWAAFSLWFFTVEPEILSRRRRPAGLGELSKV